MKTIEEQKIEAIRKILKPLTIDNDDVIFAKAILESLKQFETEQLEVFINRGFWYQSINDWDWRLKIAKTFNSQDKALDFCAKYNLKVVG